MSAVCDVSTVAPLIKTNHGLIKVTMFLLLFKVKP